MIGSPENNTVTESTWVTSAEAVWAMSDFTEGAGDGPIQVGWAHSDYTDSEIEAWVELTGGWAVGDLVQREVNDRKIKIVGVFETPRDATDVVVLNDGRPIKTKLGWRLNTGQTIKMWAYNSGSSALSVTDPAVRALGHANLFPQ